MSLSSVLVVSNALRLKGAERSTAKAASREADARHAMGTMEPAK